MVSSTARAARLSSRIERSSGVFLSSASPRYEMKTLGIVSVAPCSLRTRKAGDVGSQPV